MCEDRSYYVYVIELDSEVMSDARWSEANPNQGSTECYYVGQSAHAPECRYNQHVTARGASCLCRCHLKPRKEVKPLVVGRARYAKDYSLRLRPDLYDHLNPFETQDGSKEAERSLAENLKHAGHGAWYG